MTHSVIMVVEDEPLLRMAAVDMVEAAGFTAVEAADATAAVAILESRSDIGIVFTDIDMPRGLDGMQLAACIRLRWPPIEIVLTSGHVMPSVGALPKGTRFFSKPYRQRDVLAAFREMAAH